MPLGLVNAPVTFNRLMRKLLYGSKYLDNYVDDVLAHTPTWTDHFLSMRDFLIRMTNAHLTLRPTKCLIRFFCVPYLGHCVGKGYKLNHPLPPRCASKC